MGEASEMAGQSGRITPRRCGRWQALAFLVTLLAVSIGTYHLPGERWEKGFVGLGVLFLTAASFTLAKTIRDNQEGEGGTVED